jgi:hypothetical protein
MSLSVFIYLFTIYLVMLLLAVTIVLNDRMISEECIGSYGKEVVMDWIVVYPRIFVEWLRMVLKNCG